MLLATLLLIDREDAVFSLYSSSAPQVCDSDLPYRHKAPSLEITESPIAAVLDEADCKWFGHYQWQVFTPLIGVPGQGCVEPGELFDSLPDEISLPWSQFTTAKKQIEGEPTAIYKAEIHKGNHKLVRYSPLFSIVNCLTSSDACCEGTCSCSFARRKKIQSSLSRFWQMHSSGPRARKGSSERCKVTGSQISLPRITAGLSSCWQLSGTARSSTSCFRGPREAASGTFGKTIVRRMSIRPQDQVARRLKAMIPISWSVPPRRLRGTQTIGF